MIAGSGEMPDVVKVKDIVYPISHNQLTTIKPCHANNFKGGGSMSIKSFVETTSILYIPLSQKESDLLNMDSDNYSLGLMDTFYTKLHFTGNDMIDSLKEYVNDWVEGAFKKRLKKIFEEMPPNIHAIVFLSFYRRR